MRFLNYVWRVFATGLCFSVFGVGSLVLGLAYFPLISLVARDDGHRRDLARGAINLCFRVFFMMMHYLGLLKYRIEGAEILKNDRSCLVIANHPSLIDVVALMGIYRNACCIVKKDLFQNFFTGRVLTCAGYIPNDDDPEKLLDACAESLARGDVLIIFPEGTRTVPGQPLKLQRGAAHIALRLKAPIRTIQITVNPSTLTKDLSWYQTAPRRVDFTVSAREILTVQEYLDQGLPLSLAARRLTARMLSNIEVVPV